MPKPADRLSQQLVQAAMEFHRRGLAAIPANRAALVRLPDDPHPFVVRSFRLSYIASELVVLCGSTAVATARAQLAKGARNADELEEGTSLLSVLFMRHRDLEQPDRKLLAEAGFVGTGDSIAPSFDLVLSDGSARDPNRTMMRTLISVFRTVMQALEMGIFTTNDLVFDEQLLVLHRIEDAKVKPRVEALRESLPIARFQLAPEFDRAALSALPLTEERWIVGFFDSGRDEIDSNDESGLPAMAIFEANTEEVIAARYVEPMVVHEIAAFVFEAIEGKTLRRKSGRPEAIAILHAGVGAWLIPELNEIGVHTSVAAETAAFDARVDRRKDDLAYALAFSVRDIPPELAQEPTTIEEWEEADETLFTAMLDRAIRDVDELDYAANWFFSKDGAEVMQARPEDARPAFVEWFVTNYDGSTGEHSLVNRWLPLARSAAMRHLLAERLAGRLSIFRVKSTNPQTRSLVAIDIYTGDPETIFDPDLARGDLVGWLLPLRLRSTPAGALATLAGPKIHPFDFHSALGHLESDAVRLTPEVLRREPRRMGFFLHDLTVSDLLPCSLDTPIESESDSPMVDDLDRSDLRDAARFGPDGPAKTEASAPEFDPEVVRITFMHWLDQATDLVGGLTPREAARTPEGQTRVAMLIRALPDLPLRDGTTISQPRTEMLRAIGVEDRSYPAI